MEAIVNSTQGELGYMHCAIIRKFVDEEGEYMRVIAQSNDGLIDRLNNIIGPPGIQTRRLNYSPESVFADTMNRRTIIQTKSIDLSLSAVLPMLSKETVDKVILNQPVKSVVVVPLVAQGKEFGWFCSKLSESRRLQMR